LEGMGRVKIIKTSKKRADEDTTLRVNARISNVIMKTQKEFLDRTNNKFTYKDLLTRISLLLPYHDTNECVRILKTLDLKATSLLDRDSLEAGIKYDLKTNKWFVVTQYSNGSLLLSMPCTTFGEAKTLFERKLAERIRSESELIRLQKTSNINISQLKKENLLREYTQNDRHAEIKLVPGEIDEIDEDEDAMLNYDPNKI
jgi:hypothetical protein